MIIDLKLTNPVVVSRCTFKELYIQIAMYDVGAISKDVTVWDECTSARAFNQLKKNSRFAACSSFVMDRYPGNKK